jgi:hypothetical protein
MATLRFERQRNVRAAHTDTSGRHPKTRRQTPGEAGGIAPSGAALSEGESTHP